MKSLFLLAFMLTLQFSYAQQADQLYKTASEAHQQEKYKKAIKLCNKAIRIDPLQPSYYNLKASAQIRSKQMSEAYETFNEGIRRCPGSALLYMQRGNFFQSIAEFDQSIMDFTIALKYAESDTLKNALLNNRAASKISKRDFKGAYDDLLLAYAYDSTDIAILVNLGMICDELGMGELTMGYLLRAIEVDSTFYPAYGNIGFKYQEMGQYDKAIEYFDKVLEMSPDEPLGYSNRSYCRLKTGDIKGAKSDIEKSLKLYPENSYAYRNRALIYLEEGRTDKACEDFKTALDKGFTEMYGDEVLKLRKEHCK